MGGRGSASGGGGGGGPIGSPAALHDNPAVIRQVFNYTDPQTGLTAEVTNIRNQGPGFTTYVDINVTDQAGNVVGGAERGIRPAGQASVYHAGFGLDPGQQGQGFATRWNAQVEAGYRANGIQQITIHASSSASGQGPMVGGYTWARAGYDFAGTSRADVAGMVTHVHAPSYPAPIRDAFLRVAADPHAAPIDYAMVGWRPGATMWPGKEVMLKTSWEGVKTL